MIVSNASQVLCLWRSKCQSIHPLLASGSSESCGQTPRMQVQHIVFAANLKIPKFGDISKKNSATAAPCTQAVCMFRTSYVQSKRQQKVECNWTARRWMTSSMTRCASLWMCVFWLNCRFDDFTRCFSRVDDESKRTQESRTCTRHGALHCVVGSHFWFRRQSENAVSE